MTKEKFCRRCGRRMEWRKAWEECWEEVTYCSGACRKKRLTKEDERLEAILLQMLSERGASKSLCPSELARRRYGEAEWRMNMESVRMAARRLVVAGKAELLQKNSVVEASTAKGPIRIRLKNG